jgi:beta-galactosidase
MERQPFNRGWRFHLGDVEHARWKDPDDSSWRWVDLPHDWSIEGDRDPANPSGSSGGYFPTGRAWYRKSFVAPPEWAGRKVFLEFEGVYMNAEIWVNREFLGRYPYGYTTFLLNVTPCLQIGATNVVKVFVDNGCQLNSRWYSGSGIYRPVWLLVGDPVHVGHWGVCVTTPEVSGDEALVRVRSTVENGRPSACDAVVRSRAVGQTDLNVNARETAGAIPAGGAREYVQEVRVSAPQLWSPESPHLYRLETEVVVEGRVVDTATTAFGIRSVEIDAKKGFRLNRRPLKLMGGCVHHDNGVLGAASYARSEERKVEILKSAGYNAVRCAHNPPAPAFLDACDRLGMLVIDEAFDCWREGKNVCDYHVCFDDWWRRDLEAMVRRDRNHPSIVLWSIGNEVAERDGHSGGVQIASMLADCIRALDPTRGVTVASHGGGDAWPWFRTDDVFGVLDVRGYNYQWRQYRPDHERLPKRVICGTESTPGEVLDNWSAVRELDCAIGDFVWTALDYLGEAGVGRVEYDTAKLHGLGEYPWHHANCGDFDLCGFKRPQSYYRDMVWQTGGRLYVAVHDPVPEGKKPSLTCWGWHDVWPDWTRPGQEGRPFTVDVYSSCERVELFLNGRSAGVKPTGRQEKHMATFTVPYEPGELKAVGYDGDRRVAAHVVKTVGAPAAIRLTPDRAVIAAGGSDLCFVTVEILDRAGLVHPRADDAVSFAVQGEGTLAAVGSGNPISTEPSCGNRRKAHRGRCLAVLRSGENPGSFRLRAQADGLEGAEITVRVE